MLKPFLARALLLLLIAPFAHAENSTAIGGYVIHHNTLTTDNLSPQIASAYGIQRSRSRAMLTVSVVRGERGRVGTPVAAEVDATARNLIGQISKVDLREVREGDAIYYLGDFPVHNKEKLDFFLNVTPQGEQTPLKARFSETFYTD